jgi:hypothetical protein
MQLPLMLLPTTIDDFRGKITLLFGVSRRKNDLLFGMATLRLCEMVKNVFFVYFVGAGSGKTGVVSDTRIFTENPPLFR